MAKTLSEILSQQTLVETLAIEARGDAARKGRPIADLGQHVFEKVNKIRDARTLRELIDAVPELGRMPTVVGMAHELSCHYLTERQAAYFLIDHLASDSPDWPRIATKSPSIGSGCAGSGLPR